MPILDYLAKANLEEQLLFSDRSVSEKNKIAVKRFLECNHSIRSLTGGWEQFPLPEWLHA